MIACQLLRLCRLYSGYRPYTLYKTRLTVLSSFSLQSHLATMKQFAFFGVLFLVLAVALVRKSLNSAVILMNTVSLPLSLSLSFRRPFTCHKCRNRLLAARYWAPPASLCSMLQDNRTDSRDNVRLRPMDRDRADKAKADRDNNKVDRTKEKKHSRISEKFSWNFPNS